MKKVPCNKIKKMAGDYHQNLLAPDRASQVEFHLTECPSCRKEDEETRVVLNLLKGDKLREPVLEFWTGLSSRIMAQIRLHRLQTKKIPWYKKVWENPFGWPGYAWATALILMLLTPVVIYHINFQSNNTPSIQESKDREINWETRSMPLSVVVETLSDKESVRLAKRVMARMGKDLPGPSRLLMDDELQWDVSRSLEGLTNQELEALIKKMEPGGSAGNREEEEYVC